MVKHVGFCAFVSYSHCDAKWAVALQKHLERFRVPRQLRDRFDRRRPLRPVFRDQTELTSGSLSAAIDDALQSSGALVVICSPEAAQSRWVNEEIRRFKQLHGDGRIFPLIVRGTPHAEDPADECFPPALSRSIDETGELSGESVELLAPSILESGGKRDAFLKITAALLGVGFDELRQREQQRRQLRYAGVTGGALVIALVTTGLAVNAYFAQQDADLRRSEAENLIEFMLTDLRDRLEAVGRLDVLDAVGEKSIEYYSRVDLEEHSEQSLGRRARAFHMLGEVDDLKGELESASNAFREAYASTDELLSRSPADGERVYNHAQSVFWLGYLDWRLGRYDSARTAFEEYVTLADQLVEIDPTNDTWREESGHANINLGVYMLETAGAAEAIPFFDAALAVFEDVFTNDAGKLVPHEMLGQSHAWLADAYIAERSLEQAHLHRQQEVDIYSNLLAINPNDKDYVQYLITALSARGVILIQRGESAAAVEDLETAVQYGEDLLGLEPDNTFTTQITAIAYTDLGLAKGSVGQHADALVTLDRAASLVAGLRNKDPDVLEWELLGYRVAIAEANQQTAIVGIEITEQELGSVIRNLEQLAADNQDVADILYLLAKATYRLAQAHAIHDNPDAGTELHARVIELLSPVEANLPLMSAAILKAAFDQTGNPVERDALDAVLTAKGFKHPEFSDSAP